jgi:hypothetical protein
VIAMSEPEGDKNREHDAILALIEPAPGQKPNLEPLAELLRSDAPLSKMARFALAELLDKKFEMLDVCLVPRVTNARKRADAKRAKSEPIVKAMVAELRAGATVEAAAASVAEKLNISDRWAIQKWKEAERVLPWLYGRRDILGELLRAAVDIGKNVAEAADLILDNPKTRTVIFDALARALEKQKISRNP